MSFVLFTQIASKPPSYERGLLFAWSGVEYLPNGKWFFLTLKTEKSVLAYGAFFAYCFSIHLGSSLLVVSSLNIYHYCLFTVFMRVGGVNISSSGVSRSLQEHHQKRGLLRPCIYLIFLNTVQWNWSLDLEFSILLSPPPRVLCPRSELTLDRSL